MIYKMNVLIADPNTTEGMNSGILFNLNCYFHHTKDDDYGKKTYLTIETDDGRYKQCYDLRYDKNYNPENKKEYLENWAKNYWSGENGAWAVESLEITKV